MIEIRCPNCNKKAAESPDTNLKLMTICTRCKCRYNYNYGIYKYEIPTDMSQRFKYDKYSKLSYQEKMNLNKK